MHFLSTFSFLLLVVLSEQFLLFPFIFQVNGIERMKDFFFFLFLINFLTKPFFCVCTYFFSLSHCYISAKKLMTTKKEKSEICVVRPLPWEDASQERTTSIAPLSVILTQILCTYYIHASEITCLHGFCCTFLEHICHTRAKLDPLWEFFHFYFVLIYSFEKVLLIILTSTGFRQQGHKSHWRFLAFSCDV